MLIEPTPIRPPTRGSRARLAASDRAPERLWYLRSVQPLFDPTAEAGVGVAWLVVDDATGVTLADGRTP